MSLRRRAAGLAVLAAATCAVWPSSAAAHGLNARRDLPVPEWLFAWAAAAVLGASFVALAALWQQPACSSARASAWSDEFRGGSIPSAEPWAWRSSRW